MASLRHIVAVVLLALWLPTTQHCRLEAAGLIAEESEHGTDSACCEPSGDSCARDGCKVIEGNLTKPSNSALKAPAPSLVACVCFLASDSWVNPEVSAMPNLAVAEPERPQHWVVAWQFVRRAAPLSRAPSLLG